MKKTLFHAALCAMSVALPAIADEAVDQFPGGSVGGFVVQTQDVLQDFRKERLQDLLVGSVDFQRLVFHAIDQAHRVEEHREGDRRVEVVAEGVVHAVGQRGDFGIGLRHLENYRYSNLFVFLHTRMPNGNITHDTIECTLATPEGRWIGKSSGSMRDLVVPLNENLRFPLTGTYHFEIEQAMREPVLKGISDIGLYIEKQ